MGSLCSPDRGEHQIDTDIKPTSRRNSKIPVDESKTNSYNNDMLIDGSVTNTYSDNTNTLENNVNHHINNNNNNNNKDSDFLDDINNINSDFVPSPPIPPANIDKSFSENLDGIEDDIIPATGFGRQETESMSSKYRESLTPLKYANNTKKKGQFVIKITPPNGHENSNDDDNSSMTPISSSDPEYDSNNNYNDDQNRTYSAPSSSPLKSSKRKEKVDPTLGGKISWKKVADFSALLPRDVKLKLWNGVFKNETDLNQPELKKISKVLRTFVMLQLTREYKKTNESVPNELKAKLPSAVKEPSRFISTFIKRDEKFIDQSFLTIYETLCDKFKTNDENKKAKYAKKAKITQDNYAQLTKEDLQTEFNQQDFLKTSFLQYMLYAFQFKLDSDLAKSYSN